MAAAAPCLNSTQVLCYVVQIKACSPLANIFTSCVCVGRAIIIIVQIEKS